MTSTTAVPAPITSIPSTSRAISRWMISFLGFPIGGLAAWLLTGPVIDPTSAVTGGLLTGAVLGAAQAWALRADRRQILGWILATAVGMSLGLTVAASLVGFSTTLTDLAIQGAVSGTAVGLAQALVLWHRTGPLALAWPAYLGASWAAGWTVTTLAGIGVEEQFTVFGASGALVVALLTSVLPLVLRNRPRSHQHGLSTRSAT
jgi:hypothetical protein